jgi:hypothetical protein
MKVHDLQLFLKSLAQPLTSSGGKKVAEDLERAADGLNQFKEMTITDFCGFLDKANHFVTTGQLPPTGGRSRTQPKVSNPEDVRRKAQRLMELYERALDQDFSYDAVKQEIKELASLKVDELKQIAREMNITKGFRRKGDVLDALERKITDRRASQERTQFRPGDETARSAEGSLGPTGAPTEPRSPMMEERTRESEAPVGTSSQD